MARGGAWAAAAAAVLWWMAAGAGAVWLEIAPSGTKCVAEEIRSNVVVIGDYAVLYEHQQVHPTVSVKITSPFGDTIHKKDKVTVDQFAFTTSEAGNYLACFTVDGDNKGLVVKLNLDWKIGIAAKDWDAIAKKEKIEGVALELFKLDESVQTIYENLLVLRTKESDMRDVSEVTNARVLWLSMMSLGVCICVSVMQLVHLKRYFRKKKLI
ncbi:Transmembrane emp24 domain-containing protein 10 [Triticum urartu]|uniref:Transmembrane emp24 domain-containing protein 10 n=1 Tax=Triticum urartu TaxID=4572 RepID=M7ZBE2_TRIUA|nr:transmembrane emp24 domain-containing protein p24delta3-like [Triticum urartu]EMS57382.1 Transmembrane emp24 domain-containing protein 10 [Triticum urartu]